MKREIRLNLGAKLLLLVMGISMLITAAMGVLFYGRVTESVKNNYKNTVAENLRTRAEQFDAIMKKAYLVCTCAVESEELKALTEKDETYEALIELLRSYCRENDGIYSVYCYLKEEDLLVKASIEDSQIQTGSFLNHTWISRVAEGERQDPFSPVHNRDSTSVIQRNYFTFGKGIYDENGREKAILFVNTDEREIYFSCLQSDRNSLGTLSLVQEGEIVSSDRVSRIGTRLQEGEKEILVQVPCGEKGYVMCSLSRAEVLEKDLGTSRNWILLVAFFLNLILAGPIYLLLKQLLYPMKKLEESMNSVKEGKLSERAVIYRNDEIGSLAENFNDMLDQVETLIDDLVTQKMLKKEAELEALSYQITPHFMYNTLSSIRYGAILEGYQEMGDLLQAFIELLRISASDRGAFITVQQEIRMVQNYILLQQFRYKDSFRAEFVVEPGTELFYVPRLLIQPLVENAILHGLDHQERGNRVTVSVSRRGKNLEIRVADNGSGMTEEEIRKLLTGGYHSKFNGIGINNIMERLHLYYGERGRMHYLSPAEGGTVAVITLPASDDAEAYVI
ncbi:MAG: histidine kinase [Lachnospiraceae bacterium]|nr:histidine kinase [Lachnospiraceae bacterium]